MYQNWYSTDGPIEISGPEFKCDPGNLECMVFFSYVLLCRGGASTRWTKLDLTGLKLIFGKQSPICQSSKKKKCYNFPIGNVTFSLPDLGFMRMWVGVGV